MNAAVLWTAAGLGAAGLAVRASNALHYPIGYGFDADGNWAYIATLLQSWSLPSPDAAWSTSHPPLFYYLSAGIARGLGAHEPDSAVPAIRLGFAALGTGSAVLAAWLVRRTDPAHPWRAILAGALLLFLPAHLYASAMLNEEVLASFMVGVIAVGAALATTRRDPGSFAAPIALGVVAGLALLTKLSAAVTLAAVPLAYLVEGLRRAAWRPWALRAAAFLVAALLVGGWYYARNWIQHGYLYPHDLAIHSVMHRMPPGERGPADYLRIPAATWSDPQVLHPDLLRSVWGSTHATLWFDGHRHFLPRDAPAVRRTGTALTLLALLPLAAFAAGALGGVRRWAGNARTPDGPLLLLVGFTLAGYVAFTWRNPWFVTVKGTYLLGLGVPFAFYASEVLSRWARRGRPAKAAIAALVGTLLLGSALTFTYGLAFTKSEPPGLPWLERPAR